MKMNSLLKGKAQNLLGKETLVNIIRTFAALDSKWFLEHPRVKAFVSLWHTRAIWERKRHLLIDWLIELTYLPFGIGFLYIKSY